MSELPWTDADRRFMARAIELAKKGWLTTRPNPRVGCVIVQDETIIAEGYHQRAGEPHAEIYALQAAGEKAAGATAYVTLEPCSHYGRTSPCANALIAANISRVVVAMVDPNPQVSGRGLKMLEQAGIQTAYGLLQSEAEALNLGFIKRMKTGLPYVRIKLAASLDGRTALANGQSKWITGSAARQDVQRYRAMSDAVITGADSVLTDQPSMNVRYAELGEWQNRVTEATLQQPLRVVIDGQGRLTPPLSLAQSAGDIMLATLGEYRCVWPASIQVWSAPVQQGKVSLLALLQQLAERDCNEILIEAGSQLAGAFIAQGLWDELVLYQAPKLMGPAAKGLLQLPDYTEMSQVTALNIKDVRQIGSDLRIVLTPPQEEI